MSVKRTRRIARKRRAAIKRLKKNADRIKLWYVSNRSSDPPVDGVEMVVNVLHSKYHYLSTKVTIAWCQAVGVFGF